MTSLYAKIPGVRFVKEELYPQATGITSKHCRGLYGMNRSVGMARVKNGSDLLHSRQKILFNRMPWVVTTDTMLPFWPKPYISKRLYSGIAGMLTSDYCRAILPYSENARRLTALRNADHPKIDEILSRVRVVYPAVVDYPEAYECTTARDLQREVHLLFVGTQFFTKGGHILANVYSRLRKRYPLRLTVVSPVNPEPIVTTGGDSRGDWLSFLYQNGVNYIDKLDNHSVRALMGTADIFVMPSIDETFGTVLLEASASGLPVVSTCIRAIPEIVDNGTTGLLVACEINDEGRLVRSKNYERRLEEGLEDALLTLFNNPDRMKEMKHATRLRYLEHYTVERLSRDLAAVYEQAV